MNDRITEFWALARPDTAFSAGLPVEVARAGTPDPGLADRLRTELAHPVPDALDDVILRSLEVYVRTRRPHDLLKEALEWVRGVTYRGLSNTGLARDVDVALATRVANLKPILAGADPVQRTLSLMVARSLVGVAASAGLSGVSEATAKLVEGPEAKIELGVLEQARPVLAAWKSFPVVSIREHADLLRDGYGFDVSASEIERQALAELDVELGLTREVAGAVAARLGVSPDGTLEDIYRVMSDKRQSAEDALALARRQTLVALPWFRETLIELTDAEAAILPEATPPAMVRLVTEGEEYLVDALTNDPKPHCFVTPARCESVYTMANVVYHELAHCWNMVKVAVGARQLPPPLRVKGMPGTALLEGIAMQCEWEVFEAYRDCPASWDYAKLFDGLGIDRQQAVLEFELETRYWKIARLVRALFDARVHGAQQDYLGFLDEQAALTGFTAERLHSFCAWFLDAPGYAPCYAIGALQLAALQREYVGAGRSRREFNTRVSSMGMLPPKLWRKFLYEDDI